MRHLKATLTVLGAVTVLVLAANTVALAATGQGFLLGKSNSANAQTTLNRTTRGPVLNLHSKTGTSAPLVVNGRGRVANLNADKVDGYDSSVLRSRTYEFTGTFSGKSGVVFTLPLPTGSYLVSYSSFFTDVSSGGIECSVVTDAPSNAQDRVTGWSALVYSSSPSWKPSLTGTGLATKYKTGTVKVSCDAQSNWSTGLTPFVISATSTNKVSSSTLVPADGGIFRVQR